MPKEVKSIRWTVQLACTETGVHRDTITKGIKANSIQPGEDGKYSTQQIMSAIYGSAKLEREAREAKYRQQIDEAEMIKNEREVQEGKQGYISDMREFVADLTTRFVQMIRQSSLREPDKKQWVAEIAGLKFEPTKLIPFKS